MDPRELARAELRSGSPDVSTSDIVSGHQAREYKHMLAATSVRTACCRNVHVELLAAAVLVSIHAQFSVSDPGAVQGSSVDHIYCGNVGYVTITLPGPGQSIVFRRPLTLSLSTYEQPTSRLIPIYFHRLVTLTCPTTYHRFRQLSLSHSTRRWANAVMALTLLAQSSYAVILVVISVVLWKVYPTLAAPFTSWLLVISGPPSPSWFFGNLRQLRESDSEAIVFEQWTEEYGPVVMHRGFFSMPRLFTVDTRAINHILTHSADYEKPDQARRMLSSLLGKGVLITEGTYTAAEAQSEGEQHRQQRRIMNPAFGPSQIRELTEIFVEKSNELRDLWASELSVRDEPSRIDVIKGLSKMTLDVIGLAGFNYDFDSLNPNGKLNELAKAFEEIFVIPEKVPVLLILRHFFPIFDYVKDARSRRVEEAQQAMRRIGSQLIAEKKAAILQESSTKKGAEIGRQSVQGRDLLTLLIKANMATDIPDSQRLSDEDVLAQVPTFLVAGHETTSTATTWCLFALTQAPAVQTKLRDELLAVETDTPTMDELMALPYLDAVVRESLRLHPPVAVSMRVANKDDVVPLSAPFTARDGTQHDTVRIAAGDKIVIPIATMNRSKALWGDDAHEFRPERWAHPPDAISSIPGVWGHLLTFLGGPRACIGYRFSLVEMKALVFVLVRAFEFALAVPPGDVKKGKGIVQRPALRSDPAGGNQMPLMVRRYQRV
ncbi:cytochrome P450 [Trametes meyenii]|nr:cytochrome P450 [Trametes meyenii]